MGCGAKFSIFARIVKHQYQPNKKARTFLKYNLTFHTRETLSPVGRGDKMAKRDKNGGGKSPRISVRACLVMSTNYSHQTAY